MFKNIRKILFFLGFVLFASHSIVNVSAAKSMKSKMANVKASMCKLLPKESINVKYEGDNITLIGSVSSSEASYKAENLVHDSFPGYNIDNKLKINSSSQVMLRVRIGEVDKKNIRSDAVAVRNSDMVRVFAEPTLVALSGSSAFFQSGGEFPVVTEKGVDFKSYGVKISFSPVVLSQSKIKMDVYAEVSQLENDKSFLSSKAPHLSSKKVKTTVELAPGESFMIAGLVKDIFAKGDRDNSELVISATPYLVNPVDSNNIKLPTDQYYKHNNIELKFIANLNENAGLGDTEAVTLEGPAGLIAE